MKKLLKITMFFLISFYLFGCESNKDEIHNVDMAAIEAKNILEKMLFDVDAKSVYLAASDSFKERTDFTAWEFHVDFLAYNFPNDSIEIYGYEVGDSKELKEQITLYAKDDNSNAYTTIKLIGSKNKGYILDYVLTKDDEPALNNSAYKKFPEVIPVGESKVLNREIKIDASNSIVIDTIRLVPESNGKGRRYELIYVTELSLDNHEQTITLTNKVLTSFVGIKARSLNLTSVAIISVNEKTAPDKEMKANKIKFKYSQGKWDFVPLK